MGSGRATKVPGVAIQIRVRPEDLKRLDAARNMLGLSRSGALKAALHFFLAHLEVTGGGSEPH
jgi:hypothetical protein